MPSYRAAFAFAFVTASAAACGGGNDDPAIDAADTTDAAVDARPIDGPPVCNGMVCGGECIDTSEDEDHCGTCTTECTAGQACGSSTCACVNPDFLVPDPTFIQSQVVTGQIPMTSLGIGGYIGNEIDAILVAMPDAAVLNQAYPLSGTTPGAPPFIGIGYDVDINTQELTATFYATAGSVTFTERCSGSFSGTATGLRFTAAEGLMPPVLIQNDCAFPDADEEGLTLAFTYGPGCN